MDILWYIILLLPLISHGRACTKNLDYLDRETTDAIKGFFIGTVFFRHFAMYASEGLFWRPIDSWLSQLIVVMFLFYSGYGMMVQYSKRGDSYIRTIPAKRILPTLVNFDIAVALFFFLGLLMGRTVSIKKVVLSLVGWESVGNSNWYIFVIILCYAATFVCFSISFGRHRLAQWGRILLLGLFFLVYVFFVRQMKPSNWHNTVFAFWGGITYGLFRNQFERILDRYWFSCFVLGVAGTFTFPLLLKTGHWPWAFHNARALCFALSIVAATRRFRVKSKHLAWCGRNLFPLYIYQRAPMLLSKHFFPSAFAGGGDQWWLPCLFVASLFATFGIAWAYPSFRYPWNRMKTT